MIGTPFKNYLLCLNVWNETTLRKLLIFFLSPRFTHLETKSLKLDSYNKISHKKEVASKYKEWNQNLQCLTQLDHPWYYCDWRILGNYDRLSLVEWLTNMCQNIECLSQLIGNNISIHWNRRSYKRKSCSLIKKSINSKVQQFNHTSDII